LWLFRLCVDDYHRYIYPVEGRKSSNRRISGVFHTVNPIAGEVCPIYKENTREFCLIRNENLGTVLMMEVGAMLVGRIENRQRGSAAQVLRGEEKGNFAFGGSTILLMTERGRVTPLERFAGADGAAVLRIAGPVLARRCRRRLDDLRPLPDAVAAQALACLAAGVDGRLLAQAALWLERARELLRPAELPPGPAEAYAALARLWRDAAAAIERGREVGRTLAVAEHYDQLKAGAQACESELAGVRRGLEADRARWRGLRAAGLIDRELMRRIPEAEDRIRAGTRRALGPLPREGDFAVSYEALLAILRGLGATPAGSGRAAAPGP
ncbi:MAG: phosphatidylserine decarboxylase, partial [Duodenibacillus sp.]|nr:phosphatidylserine decarboxylase [Duodenibacillus sp.]